jgi:hypothetical protein
MAIITIPTITRRASSMHFPRNSCNTLLPPRTPLRNRGQVGRHGPDDPGAETIHEVVDISAYFVQRQVHASTNGGNLHAYRQLRLWMGCGTQQPQGSKEFWSECDEAEDTIYKESNAVRLAVWPFLPHMAGRNVSFREDNRAISYTLG